MTPLPDDGPHRQCASALRSWPQRLVHVLAVLAGWAIFFWGWHEVLGRPWDNRTLWWLIAGSLVVLPAFTIAWILHNRGIHRRKGPRLGVPHVNEAYAVDWNGRPVRADWVALGRAHLVVIDVEGDDKVYRVAGTPSQPGSPASKPGTDPIPDDRPTRTADWSAA